MRVLLCHDYYRSSAPSGEDIVYRNERRLLEIRGIDIIPFERNNDDIDDTTFINRVRLAKSTVWSSEAYKDISDLVRKMRPDIAHFHNTFPLISPSAYIACQTYGVPVVQTLHNYRLICPGALLLRKNQPCEDCVGNTLIPALQHRCYRNSLPATAALVGMLAYHRLHNTYQTSVDSYIALTKFAASRLRYGGLPAEKIVIKPNFLPNPPAIGPGDGGYAVFVGRLSEEKGVHTLLDAWNNLEGMHLKILGDGPLREELEARASQQRINVEFMGSKTHQDVINVVRHAALLIIPSVWYEGFPMVALEAYACGTPVVATRIGSLDEIVVEGKTGTKFEPNDANDLANKIMALIQDRHKLMTLRKTTRSHFDKNFTGDINYSILINIYRKAIRTYLKIDSG